MSLPPSITHGSSETMNTSQKKLYKKLMKSLDESNIQEEESRLKLIQETPAEIFQRKLEFERRSELYLRERAEKRLAKQYLKDNANDIKRAENKVKRDNEVRRLNILKDIAEKKMIEINTHKFFRLNAFNRPISTGVIYFGDAIYQNEAWTPHGEGEYTVNGEILYSGGFSNGQIHGLGIYTFPNDDVWKGTFRFDELHGVGVLTHTDDDDDDGHNAPPTRIECMYYKNKRVCTLTELTPGTRLNLLGNTHQSKGCTVLNQLPKEEGGLGWHFRVKLDDGGVQSLHLADAHFAICTKTPKVTLLEDYVSKSGVSGATRNGTREEKRYEYGDDSTLTLHKENWFSDRVEAVIDTSAADLLKARKAYEARLQAKEDGVANKLRSAEIEKARVEKREEEKIEDMEQEREKGELEGKKVELLEKRKKEEEEKIRKRGL